MNPRQHSSAISQSACRLTPSALGASRMHYNFLYPAQPGVRPDVLLVGVTEGPRLRADASPLALQPLRNYPAGMAIVGTVNPAQIRNQSAGRLHNFSFPLPLSVYDSLRLTTPYHRLTPYVQLPAASLEIMFATGFASATALAVLLPFMGRANSAVVELLPRQQQYTGDGTFYAAGLGACGITNTDADLIAAVGYQTFDSYPGATGNPNSNPICGKEVVATYQGKSVTVKITDRCAGCAGAADLDFTPTAFNMLADASVGRISGMTWKFSGSGGGNTNNNSTGGSSSVVGGGSSVVGGGTSVVGGGTSVVGAASSVIGGASSAVVSNPGPTGSAPGQLPLATCACPAHA
ncbi:Barwin-like endoglucanase [Mycena kentingensis (nom. inval.)]|nr:Barwin-like endoglucanase [Mycena kentingensis (nom. inval.)]